MESYTKSNTCRRPLIVFENIFLSSLGAYFEPRPREDAIRGEGVQSEWRRLSAAGVRRRRGQGGQESGGGQEKDDDIVAIMYTQGRDSPMFKNYSLLRF
jgi:hypothetical protein